MKVAVYQAPYLPFGSMDAIELIQTQVKACQAEQVDYLCCPEAIIGGLAHESAGQSPDTVAIAVHNGDLLRVVAPLLQTSVTIVVGFTERAADGRLFNSAAILSGAGVVGVYRKVFPGYQTVFRSGTELPVFNDGPAPVGIMICNDIWYLEPARVLAARGAAVIFVPTNSGHIKDGASEMRLRPRGENLPIARAVENTTTIAVADVVGSHNGRRSLGSSRIVDPDGKVLAAAPIGETCLLIADVESERRTFDPRGWDSGTNPSVTEAFESLWT